MFIMRKWTVSTLLKPSSNFKNGLGGGFNFFMFTPIWGRFPIWLIFFRWVETTNQWSISQPAVVVLTTLMSCSTSFLVGRLFSHVADKRYWKALNNTGGNVGSLEMWRKSVILVSWPSDDLWVEYLGEPCCVDYLRLGPRFAVNIFVLEVSLKERVLFRESQVWKRTTEKQQFQEIFSCFFVNNDQLRCHFFIL